MPELAEHVIVAGRFKLIRKLGQGGMGSVWLATHMGLDTPCAIKFIEGDYAMVPEMQQRFEREAKAAASLRSPNVVQIIDHAIWDGVPFIAMELLDGEDLRHRLEKVGRLSSEQTIEVLGQVCRALTKAHGLGIVHRDLKPDNIYLVRDDDREIAKVLDFGIAKSNKPGGMESGGSNTRTGAMMGTPYYMSPEQAQGTKAVDLRADLWSMAVIAFQCMTGKLPFESEALGDLLMKIMVAPLPVPSQFAPVPPSFDAWFAKAASRDPAGRFQSSKEFIDSLGQALGVATGTTGGGRPSVHQGMPPVGGTLPLGAVTPNPYVPNTNPGFGSNPSFTPNPAAPPIARTFPGAPPEGLPKKSPLPIVIGVVGVLILGAVGVGVYAIKGKGSTTAGPVPAASTLNTPTATAVTAAVTAPTVATPATATPATTAVATGVPATPTTATAVAGIGTPKATATAKASGHASAAATPPVTPTATTTGKRDMGF